MKQRKGGEKDKEGEEKEEGIGEGEWIKPKVSRREGIIHKNITIGKWQTKMWKTIKNGKKKSSFQGKTKREGKNC